MEPNLGLAVLKDIVYVGLGPAPPGGSGGGSGRPLSVGDRGFWVGSRPDPGEIIFNFVIYVQCSWSRFRINLEGSQILGCGTSSR